MLPPPLLLALDAALGEPARAAEAWRQLAPVARLDGQVQRLLPLIQHNLPGLRDPVLDAAALATFVGNGAIVGHALPVLGELRARGLRVALLKGASLLDPVYRDWGARVLSDVDLLVERADLSTAFAVLLAAGYRAFPDGLFAVARCLRAEHGQNFASEAGGRIDLHWSPLRAFPWPRDGTDHFAHAEPARLQGAEVFRLAPADELFIACVHGAHDRLHRGVASAQWAADAVMLLRAYGARVDWERVGELATSRQFARSLAGVLGWLARRLGAEVPAPTLARLAGARVSVPEQVEWLALRAPPLPREIMCEVARFQRMRARPRYRPPVRGATRYLADKWTLTREIDVPAGFARRVARHLLGRGPTPEPTGPPVLPRRRARVPARAAPLVIVAHRGRRDRLDALLARLPAYLERSGLGRYTLAVSEQYDDDRFNAATCRDAAVAFARARRLPGDYYVFQDVGTIPLDGVDYGPPVETEVGFLDPAGARIFADVFTATNGWGSGFAELPWRLALGGFRWHAWPETPAATQARVLRLAGDDPAEPSADSRVDELRALPPDEARGYMALFGLSRIDPACVTGERRGRVWWIKHRRREVFG
jgi:hypothetical protein